MKRIFIIIVALVYMPLAAQAETVLRVGDSVSVLQNQSVENDFYAAAADVTVSGPIDGDVYAAGNTVTLNGDIEEDAAVFAASVSANGAIGDDFRALAGDVVIADSVAGDVFVSALSVKILSSAEIAGDVYVFASDVSIEGSVAGSIKGHAKHITVDGSVAGDIDIASSGGLALGNKASIEGDITYKSPVALARAVNAVVEGEIVAVPVSVVPEASNVGQAFGMFVLAIFGAIAYFLFIRNRANDIVATTANHSLGELFVGSAAVLVALFVAVLFGGISLGFSVGAAFSEPWIAGFFVVWGVAFAAVAGLMVLIASLHMMIVIGFFVQKYLLKRSKITLQTAVLGAVASQILLLIPVIGTPIFGVLLVFALGNLLWYMWHNVRLT